jgi:hypothetical protein
VTIRLSAGFTFFTALLLAGASVFLFVSMYQPDISVRYMWLPYALGLSPTLGLGLPLILSLLFAVLALVQAVRALALLLDLHWEEQSPARPG